jgi:hypothetical protein
MTRLLALAPRIDHNALEVTEAHARRVTSQMIAALAPACARFSDDLAKLITGAGRLGNPVSQQRFVDRLKRAKNPPLSLLTIRDDGAMLPRNTTP